MVWATFGGVTTAALLAFSIVVGTVSTDKGVHGAAVLTRFVQSDSGRVTGSVKTRDNYTYIVYKSIPFAKPPLGELRFKRPQPLERPANFEDLINTDGYKPSCWSITKKSTNKYYGEDCLYLNVFVPEGDHSLLPVMVWLHGGGFVAGSTFPEPGKMVSQGGVIVVTVNYRLGPFGFMTTLSDALPSNVGLFDQYMAIKWVQEHIDRFGGDQNSITVFGESAGAASVGLHIISPFTAPLFHKAILQSGAMTSLLTRDPRQVAQRFAQLVGCSSKSGDPEIECLQNTSIDDLLKYSKPEFYVSVQAEKQVDFVWMPVIDGKFVLDEPLRLIKNTTYLESRSVFDKDYMIGVLSDEGALVTNNFMYPLPVSDVADVTFYSDLVNVMFYKRYGPEEPMTEEISKAIHTFYTGSSVLTSSPYPTSVLDFGGDIEINVPALEAALAVSNPAVEKARKTFFYHFDFCPTGESTLPPCFGHGDDVGLQFPGKPITDPVQAKLSDLYISLLTTFATTSQPGAVVSCGWPEFDQEERRYLRIAPTPDVRRRLYDYRMKFWLETLPSLQNESD